MLILKLFETYLNLNIFKTQVYSKTRISHGGKKIKWSDTRGLRYSWDFLISSFNQKLYVLYGIDCLYLPVFIRFRCRTAYECCACKFSIRLENFRWKQKYKYESENRRIKISKNDLYSRPSFIAIINVTNNNRNTVW